MGEGTGRGSDPTAPSDADQVIIRTETTTMTYEIGPQGPHHLPLVDPLLDRTFGPDRTAKTVYRLREGLEAHGELSFVALDRHGGLLASLRFWPIRIEAEAGILLGPLAVEPGLQGRGIGRGLVGHGLAEARRLGHRLCVVVGEPEYYRPFGFVNAPSRGLHLPGPVDPRRFQVCELEAGALSGLEGWIGRADELAVGDAPPESLRA